MQRRHVDGVAHGEVHGGIDDVSQCGFVVLDGATLAVTVTQEDQFLPLAGPEGTHTLTIHLYRTQNTEHRTCKIFVADQCNLSSEMIVS